MGLLGTILGGVGGFMVGGPAGAVAGAAIGGSIGEDPGAGAGEASEATLQASREAEALNRERYQQAQGYMEPFAGRSNIAAQQLQAELGLPQYMDQGGVEFFPPGQEQMGPFQDGEPSASPYATPGQEFTTRDMSDVPGYQAVMDESLRAVEQSAVSSGSTAYGGRRLEAAGEVGAGVQQSYYNNYMNMLQNLATPTVATNLSSMGMNQGVQMGQQNIAATNQSNQYMMAGAAARNAQQADLMGGIFNLGAGALSGGYI